MKNRHAEERRRLDEGEKQLAVERDKLAGEFERLTALRSEFHSAAAATRDRLRDAWAAVEGQQQRATVDWTEADRYFAEQTAQLEARAAELAQREKVLADGRARGEARGGGPARGGRRARLPASPTPGPRSPRSRPSAIAPAPNCSIPKRRSSCPR